MCQQVKSTLFGNWDLPRTHAVWTEMGYGEVREWGLDGQPFALSA